MDYEKFYRRLFVPLESIHGPIDGDTIVAIIGFEAGGPLNFCTFGRESSDRFITYVSCELAVREEQQPSEFGRYELLIACDDERWVRGIVSDIGRMSFEVPFGHGQTMDIGPWVESGESIQGIVFEKVCATKIDRKPYGVMRIIGVTRPEMEYTQVHTSSKLIACLRGRVGR